MLARAPPAALRESEGYGNRSSGVDEPVLEVDNNAIVSRKEASSGIGTGVLLGCGKWMVVSNFHKHSVVYFECILKDGCNLFVYHLCLICELGCNISSDINSGKWKEYAHHITCFCNSHVDYLC